MRGKLVFLGTSAGVPTESRSLPSLALVWSGEIILFDVGEGTQHRMIKAQLSPVKVTKIFITHMHGDHVLGLPGLIMTMSLMKRTQPLEVFGPPGIKTFLNCLLPTIHEDEESTKFSIIVNEITQDGLVVSEKDYEVYSIKVKHSIENRAYKFVEKDRPGKFNEEVANKLGIPEGPLRKELIEGKSITLNGKVITPEMVVGPPRPGFKLVYTGDTAYSENLVEFSKDVDILVHESTFDSSKEDAAKKVFHSLASDAAVVAALSRAKKLVLTHFSARYKDPSVLVEDARRVFKNVVAAEDLMEIIID